MKLFTNIVFGESSVHVDARIQIERCVNRIAYLEQQELIKSKVRTATAYPIFISVMGTLSVFVMLTFVIPNAILAVKT